MPTTPSELVQQMQWRYAVKKFDATKVIAAEVWEALEHALVLTPSSYGLQPWKFLVVTSPEIKQRLVPASWNQKQPADCSHMVVLAIKHAMDAEWVDKHIARSAELRNVPIDSMAGMRKMIVGGLLRPEVNIDDWAARQVYIALGNFMTAAALLGVDTCPMEGIVPGQYDEILGLPAQGYTTCVACAAGYRAADDKYATTPKVRFAHGEMVQRL